MKVAMQGLSKVLEVDSQELLFLTYSVATGLLVGVFSLAYLGLFNTLSSVAQRLSSASVFARAALPMVGLATSSLVLLLLTGYARHLGTHNVIYAYHFRGGEIKARETLADAASSILTISLGGSAGLESPGLHLGGGIGSLASRLFRLEAGDRRRLMIAGAAAGLSAIFRAPLSGTLFALEIPYLFDIEKEVFLPALLASAASSLVVLTLSGGETLAYPFLAQYSMTVEPLHVVLAGVASAAVGLLFVRFYKLVQSRLARLRLAQRIALGGAILGTLVALFPEVSGTGYGVIEAALRNELNASIGLLDALLLLKIVATSLTLSSGGSGGLFIPSLYVGAVMGLAYTRLFGLDPRYTPVFMSAVLASTTKTAIMPVVFVAELYGGGAIVPASLASVIAYFLSGHETFYEDQLLRRPPLETYTLAEVYSILKQQKPEVLEKYRVAEFAEKPFAITLSTRLEQLLAIAAKREAEVFPVVTNDSKLIGYLTLTDVLSFNLSNPSLSVEALPIRRPLTVQPSEPIGSLAELMVEECETHAFVIDAQGRLLGVISADKLTEKLLPHFLSGGKGLSKAK
ncbi:chloride channel protein [Infirmifilum sp. SLHALR2]|nr:MAG: hypothetical protein B7L53_07870 [Thermofilum sp. NZ13]